MWFKFCNTCNVCSFRLGLQRTFEKAINLDVDMYQSISTIESGVSTLGMYVAICILITVCIT